MEGLLAFQHFFRDGDSGSNVQDKFPGFMNRYVEFEHNVMFNPHDLRFGFLSGIHSESEIINIINGKHNACLFII